MRASWRIPLLVLAVLATSAFALLGWRGKRTGKPPIELFHDMAEQPKLKPQSASAWFADGRAQRLPVSGSVAWGRRAGRPDPGFLQSAGEAFAAGKIPLPLDRALLERGRHLFTIYCAPCHGESGHGDGVMTHYGLNPPPSYHGLRLRSMAPGELFKVVTLGKGQMASYADRLGRFSDRWAVVAYVRALQRAFFATLADVPEAIREELLR